MRRRRLSFDTASDFFMREPGIVSVEGLRAYFKDKPITFHGATVFDASTRKFHAFRKDEADQLLAMLLTADELISHSGSKADRIVLEHACGEERTRALEQIKH